MVCCPGIIEVGTRGGSSRACSGILAYLRTSYLLYLHYYTTPIVLCGRPLLVISVTQVATRIEHRNISPVDIPSLASALLVVETAFVDEQLLTRGTA